MSAWATVLELAATSRLFIEDKALLPLTTAFPFLTALLVQDVRFGSGAYYTWHPSLGSTPEERRLALEARRGE